jgi:hypothetical protein
MSKQALAFTVLLISLVTTGWSQKPVADSIHSKAAKTVGTLPAPKLYLRPLLTSTTRVQFVCSGMTQKLPFFCGAELLMEKRLKMPFRFRLGSVQQVDWLEGKPLSVKPD